MINVSRGCVLFWCCVFLWCFKITRNFFKTFKKYIMINVSCIDAMFFYDVSTQWFRMKNYYIWSMSVMGVSSITLAVCDATFFYDVSNCEIMRYHVFDTSLSHCDSEYGTMRVFWDFYRTFMRLLHLQDFYETFMRLLHDF